MTLRSITKGLERVIVNNSNTILTGLGVAGVIVTSFLTAKATFKAANILLEELDSRVIDDTRTNVAWDELITPREKIDLVWKEYIPAATTASLTILSIIFANRIGNRRAAALAAAYTITERAYTEYRDKIVSTIGPKKEEVIRSEIAKERINKVSSEVIISCGGDVLCYDSFTGRTFLSDMERLRRAENEINHTIVSDFYASLSDYYNLIGLPATSYSDEVGWNSDKLLSLRFSAVLCEDNRPCINVDFSVTPVKYFNRLG